MLQPRDENSIPYAATLAPSGGPLLRSPHEKCETIAKYTAAKQWRPSTTAQNCIPINSYFKLLLTIETYLVGEISHTTHTPSE